MQFVLNFVYGRLNYFTPSIESENKKEIMVQNLFPNCRLPIELFIEILRNCSFKEICTLQMVSKDWKKLTEHSRLYVNDVKRIALHIQEGVKAGAKSENHHLYNLFNPLHVSIDVPPLEKVCKKFYYKISLSLQISPRTIKENENSYLEDIRDSAFVIEEIGTDIYFSKISNIKIIVNNQSEAVKPYIKVCEWVKEYLELQGNKQK